MAYLDKRNETYGADLKIVPAMLCRAEIKNTLDQGTDVTVQELINALCDVLDGVKDYDMEDYVGPEMAERVIVIRQAIRSLWTHADGTKVIS